MFHLAPPFQGNKKGTLMRRIEIRNISVPPYEHWCLGIYLAGPVSQAVVD
jgi:hypothetical protein